MVCEAVHEHFKHCSVLSYTHEKNPWRWLQEDRSLIRTVVWAWPSKYSRVLEMLVHATLLVDKRTYIREMLVDMAGNDYSQIRNAVPCG